MKLKIHETLFVLLRTYERLINMEERLNQTACLILYEHPANCNWLIQITAL